MVYRSLIPEPLYKQVKIRNNKFGDCYIIRRKWIEAAEEWLYTVTTVRSSALDLRESEITQGLL